MNIKVEKHYCNPFWSTCSKWHCHYLCLLAQSQATLTRMNWMYMSLSKFPSWNPNLQCDGIKRRGLWEIMRSWGHGGGALISEISALIKGKSESFLAFCHVKTQWTWKRVFTRTGPYWHPDLSLLASITVRKYFCVYKPDSLPIPCSLWYFVMVAQTKTPTFLNKISGDSGSCLKNNEV